MSEPLVLRDRRWAVEDLDELPTDDGNRYEIIDGVLVVSRAPGAWDLGADGLYRRVADVTGNEPFDAVLPYPVRVRPADLVR